MPLFFYLLTNDHFQEDFLNKLYILSTFNTIWLPFHKVYLIEDRRWTTLWNHEELFNVKKNLLARALINAFPPFCFLFLLSTSKNEELLTFIKATVHTFVISITCALFSVDWLTLNFTSTLRNTVNSLRLSIII